MQDDPKVKCSAKKPQHWSPTFRARWSAYKDAYCMAWCNAYHGRFGRAFYGVELKYVVEVFVK